jgi:HlyD family secretion protein
MDSSLTFPQPRIGVNPAAGTAAAGRFVAAAARLPRWLMITIAIVIATAIYMTAGRAAPPHYATVLAARGTVAPSVSATGTINPVTTVQVGSYVSGPIQAIYADFNSPVKRGQLIARIDPRPFQMKVDQAKAALANAQAQLRKDQADAQYKKISWQRQEELYKAQVVSADAADSALAASRESDAQAALDQANIAQNQSALQEAQVNLEYTNIVSPVDGIVVSRNVDVGQTVAASFQTPTLFLIAKDLTHMQVDTNVSESDIGGIKPGQQAVFTVDAFAGRQFEGVVSQVRQAPITVQNVVTYDVVISVANPQALLKPGMTASVMLETARHDGVLRVPVQALHFNPSKTAAAPGKGQPAVWVDDGGTLRRVAVTPGISDGDNVEIAAGDLREGQAVVVGEAQAASARASQTNALAGPRLIR